MVNDLITALAINLKVFDGVKVYTDSIHQDLAQPCFILSLRNSQHAKSAVNIRTTRPGIAVVYIGIDSEDIRDVASRLSYALEKASYKGGVWIGHDITIEVDNEAHTLTAAANYAEQIVIPEIKDKMQSYTHTLHTQKARG